jgi:diacylglycerol kinase family enzyme
MAVIANSTRYGTGAIINPTGDLEDGRFELIILRPHPVWLLLKLIFVMFAGTIHRQKFVKVFSLRKTEIQLSEPHELQIDGEVHGLHQRIEAESIPRAVEVLVP